MESVAASSMSAAASMPRFGDGSVNLQELARQLVEQKGQDEGDGTEAEPHWPRKDRSVPHGNGYRDESRHLRIGTGLPCGYQR